MKVRHNILAKVLGISKDALSKQRKLNTSPYECQVIEERVLNNTDSMSPSLFENIEKLTMKPSNKIIMSLNPSDI